MLNIKDCQNLLGIINNSDFKGSDSDYVTELKIKIKTIIKEKQIEEAKTLVKEWNDELYIGRIYET